MLQAQLANGGLYPNAEGKRTTRVLQAAAGEWEASYPMLQAQRASGNEYPKVKGSELPECCRPQLAKIRKRATRSRIGKSPRLSLGMGLEKESAQRNAVLKNN